MKTFLEAARSKARLNASQIERCQRADLEGATALDMNLGKRGWLFMAREGETVIARIRRIF